MSTVQENSKNKIGPKTKYIGTKMIYIKTFVVFIYLCAVNLNFCVKTLASDVIPATLQAVSLKNI